VFGELTVIGYSHSHVQPSGQKRAIWFVRCSCGIEKTCSTSTLLSKNAISCGHVGAENRVKSRVVKDAGAAKNYLFLSYKKRAEYRKLPFELDKDFFIELTQKDCVYCGAKPFSLRSGHGSAQSYKYNGLDRVDNSKGYEKDNVVPCCKICNQMKMDMKRSDFLAHIKRIFSHAN
jgi:hypothetical protein